jgi:nucleotide-binding universal stress UspA family protein
MFKRILLPTDGSALSRASVHRGVEFAKRLQAAVLGVVVIPERKYYLYQTGIIVQSKEETIRQHRPEADRILASSQRPPRTRGSPVRRSSRSATTRLKRSSGSPNKKGATSS